MKAAKQFSPSIPAVAIPVRKSTVRKLLRVVDLRRDIERIVAEIEQAEKVICRGVRPKRRMLRPFLRTMARRNSLSWKAAASREMGAAYARRVFVAQSKISDILYRRRFQWKTRKNPKRS